MSTAIFTRIGKNQFTKLRVYRDFGGASVKNDCVSAVSEKRPIHLAVQSAAKITNASRASDPYLAQHLRDLERVYFAPKQ